MFLKDKVLYEAVHQFVELCLLNISSFYSTLHFVFTFYFPFFLQVANERSSV